MNKYFKKLILDMIPVVIGILVALFINNWKERSNDQKFINTIMTNMELEMRENHTDLKDVLPKHERLIDSIYAHLDDDTTLDEIFTSSRGFQIALVKNTSWRALQNQNLRLIDYELIKILTNVEEGKLQQDLKLDKAMDFIYEHINNPSREKKLIAALIIEDLKVLEEDLLALYEQFLKLREQ